MLTHANLAYQVRSLPAFLTVRPGERVLSLLPPWHIYERTCSYYVLSSGGHQVGRGKGGGWQGPAGLAALCLQCQDRGRRTARINCGVIAPPLVPLPPPPGCCAVVRGTCSSTGRSLAL